MKKSVKSDCNEVSHSKTTSILAKNAVSVREQIYTYYIICDDMLEGFRQDVSEMLSASGLMLSLIGHRAAQGVKKLRGAGRVSGTAVVDRHFEDHAETVFEDLRTGRFGCTVERIERGLFRVSKLMDRASLRSHRLAKRIEARIDAVIEHYIENRRRWQASLAAMAGCFMMFCVTVNAGTVYNYYYHGTEIGTVKDKAQVEEAVEQVQEELSKEYNVEVAVNAGPNVDITYEKQFSFSAIIDNADEVADKLVNSEELEGSGFAIRVNGTVAALVDTEETAERIMATVKEGYITHSADQTGIIGEAADPSEQTEAPQTQAEQPTKFDSAVVRSLILQESKNSQTGVVSAADEGGPAGFELRDLDFADFDIAALKGIRSENVTITDEVSIEPVTSKVSDFIDYDQAIGLFVDEEGKSKIFNVSTSEIEIYTESVPYETEYEDSDDMYEGQEEVKSTGTEGEKQIVARVTKENGQETGRDIINETVLTEPVSEIVLKGTMEAPSWVASGAFMTPASGKFTSGFGARWGRQHKGVDIAAPAGTPVYAADGGTVTFASFHKNGFGNLVKIDHGNGYETYYAHNSELCVSVGDKVYKGQLIAKVGSTGRSTGNHCHFEVHYNGTALNPSDFISL